MEIIVVEMVFLFVTVERNDGADRKCPFMIGATMASLYSPAIGSVLGLPSFAVLLWSEASPVAMALVTNGGLVKGDGLDP